MYQCAGICYSRKNRLGMACVIRLSEPLLKLRARKDLVETLLHEMIHAWNFIRGIMEENGGHGQNFLSKMHEINRLAGTNISVYHTFHDEVEMYKTHWWRCDGMCKDRAPYHGFVKRTSNRAPSKNDFWWNQHQQTCGGTFIKVKEPEKSEKKKKENVGKTGDKKPRAMRTPNAIPKKPSKTSPGADIRKFFKPSADAATPKKGISTSGVLTKPEINSEGGQSLGGQGTGRSRLLDMFQDKVPNMQPKKRKLSDNIPGTSIETIVIDDFIPPSRDHKSFHISIRQELDDDDDEIILIDDEFDDNFRPLVPLDAKPIIKPVQTEESEMCNCPVCNVSILITKVNEHLDQCLVI